MTQCLKWETALDVHDHADLVKPVELNGARLMKRCGLDDGAGSVAACVELLAVEHAVDDRIGCPEDCDAADDEAFDLVHVEALVDPADEERSEERRVGKEGRS